MSSEPTQAAPAGQPESSASSEPAPAKSLGPLGMIWRETIKYPKQVIAAIVALCITSAATISIPDRLRSIVDTAFGPGANAQSIDRVFQYLMMIVLVLGIATAIRFYFVSWLGERVVGDLRYKVQANLLRLPPSFFEENSPKEISSRMTSDTAIIEQVVGTTVSVALRNSLTTIFGVSYLFYLAPKLTAGLILGIPLVVVPITWFGRRLRNISRTSQDRVADIGARTAEVLGAMRVVQAFNQEDHERQAFSAVVEQTFATAKRRIRIRAAMTSVVIILVLGGIVLLMWEGAVKVAEGALSGGTIAGFVMAGGIVAGSFGSRPVRTEKRPASP